MAATYRLLLVAFSICSSRALLAPDDHQLIILGARVWGLSLLAAVPVYRRRPWYGRRPGGWSSRGQLGSWMHLNGLRGESVACCD